MLAWAPLWSLWFLISMSAPGQSVPAAARDATVAIGAAALLGIAVWRFTGVYVWPEQLHFKFYGMHLVAGSLFAVLWMLPMIGAEALRRHVGVVEIVQLPRLVAWFAIGSWIYLIVTGISYAIRSAGGCGSRSSWPPKLGAVVAFERHDDKRVRARLTNGTTVVASRAWSSALRGKAT